MTLLPAKGRIPSFYIYEDYLGTDTTINKHIPPTIKQLVSLLLPLLTSDNLTSNNVSNYDYQTQVTHCSYFPSHGLVPCKSYFANFPV
jgi:hypothetical protein